MRSGRLQKLVVGSVHRIGYQYRSTCRVIKMDAIKADLKEMKEETDKIPSILDKCMRKAQKTMLTCSMRCLDNGSGMDQRELKSCFEGCEQPLLKLSNYLKVETENLQERYDRCTLNCKASAVLEQKSDDNSNNNALVQSHLEGCVKRCNNKCIAGLPDWEKKLRNAIKNNSYS